MLLYEKFLAFAAGTKYSVKGSMRGRNALALMYRWNGTLAATATLWASNLDNPDIANDTDWIQVTDVALTSPAGSAGSFGQTIGNAHFRWYRLKFVRSAGSGDLEIWVDHVAAATRS